MNRALAPEGSFYWSASICAISSGRLFCLWPLHLNASMSDQAWGQSTAIYKVFHRTGTADSLTQSLQHFASFYRAASFFIRNLLIEVAIHAICQLLCKNTLFFALAQCPSDYPATAASILSVVDAFDSRLDCGRTNPEFFNFESTRLTPTLLVLPTILRHVLTIPRQKAQHLYRHGVQELQRKEPMIFGSLVRCPAILPADEPTRKSRQSELCGMLEPLMDLIKGQTILALTNHYSKTREDVSRNHALKSTRPTESGDLQRRESGYSIPGFALVMPLANTPERLDERPGLMARVSSPNKWIEHWPTFEE